MSLPKHREIKLSLHSLCRRKKLRLHFPQGIRAGKLASKLKKAHVKIHKIFTAALAKTTDKAHFNDRQNRF